MRVWGSLEEKIVSSYTDVENSILCCSYALSLWDPSPVLTAASLAGRSQLEMLALGLYWLGQSLGPRTQTSQETARASEAKLITQ